MSIMRLAFQGCADALDARRSAPCRSELASSWTSLRPSSDRTLPLEGKWLRLIWLSQSFSPWDGTNITYGRHHAVTEPLSSPSTNNSVAMGFNKKEWNELWPPPSQGHHVLQRISVAPAASPDQQEARRDDRERGGGCDCEKGQASQLGSRGLQCCGGEGEHTERYIERGSLWAAQRRASAWGNGMSTAVWQKDVKLGLD